MTLRSQLLLDGQSMAEVILRFGQIAAFLSHKPQGFEAQGNIEAARSQFLFDGQRPTTILFRFYRIAAIQNYQTQVVDSHANIDAFVSPFFLAAPGLEIVVIV